MDYLQYEHFAAGSAADFSGLNDAPAGKYGFVCVRNGHLAFENGGRVRFFGINLGHTAALCDHETAERTAEDLLRAGMNMARIHHVDGNFPAGLLNYAAGDSQTLNEFYFERLDYLAWQLKKRGIYLHIDLCTRRTYLPGDGFTEDEIRELVHFVKSVQHYDERIIALQKKYIRQYLFHVNPYTGLRYIDDPAVAVVQYVNENAVFWDNLPTRAPSFAKALDNRFNAWLLEKYGTRVALDAAWTNEAGEKALHADEDPECGTVMRPPLGDWAENRADFTADYTGANSTARHMEHMAFLRDLQEKNVREILRFFDEIGVRCVRNYSNLPNGAADLSLNALADLTEHNAYWNHPLGGFTPPVELHGLEMCRVDITKGWDSFAQHTAAAVCKGKVAGMPYMTTEYCGCFPTAFRADQLLQMACYGAFQDMDGLLLFAYSAPEAGSSPMRGFFDVRHDPAVWTFAGMAAAVFRNGLVRPGKNNIEIGMSEMDCLLTPPGYGLLLQQAMFVSRVSTRFLENGRYAGDADIVISAGHSATGDYTAAARALLHSVTPYADGFRKRSARAGWLTAHGSKPVACAGARVRRLPVKRAHRALHSAMRDWGLLPEGAGYQQSGTVVSDTGELRFSYRTGRWLVHTDCVRVAAGYLPKRVDIGGISLHMETKKAAVALLALDGRPVEKSGHMLLAAVGESGNTDMQRDGATLLDAGRGPVWTEAVLGRVCLPRTAVVYALGADGARVERIGGGACFPLSGGLLYEVCCGAEGC